MSTNNSDMSKYLQLFEGKTAEKKKEEPKKTAKKEEKLDEFKMKPTPKSKKGMFKGKTKEELRAMATATKKKMKSHEDKGESVPEALKSKMAEINFALRAKNDWGKAESKEPDTKKKVVKEKKAVKEDIEVTEMKKYLAENFWGGDSQPEAPSAEDDEETPNANGEESPMGSSDSHDSEEGNGEENPEDVLKMDVPVFLKFLEYARENADSDDALHELAEKITKCCGDGDKTITMDDYEQICDYGSEECGDSEESNEPKQFGQEQSSEEEKEEDEDDGYDRSMQAESIRHIMKKLGMGY